MIIKVHAKAPVDCEQRDKKSNYQVEEQANVVVFISIYVGGINNLLGKY